MSLLRVAAAKPKQEKSPLNKDEFIDFKLKQVIPYNHNTSKYARIPCSPKQLLM